MNFAKQQLEKYGWKDGDGLGKNKKGIAKPLKAKLKFDNAGLGHNLADEIVNPWWQRVYDSAAEGVKVSKTDGEVNIEAGDTEVTTKKRKHKKKKKEPEVTNKYNNFVMRAALTEGGEKRLGSDGEEDEDNEPAPKKKTSGICDLTDEELFRACGGRTAHKGARHGLSMSAKLQRSQQLEIEALQKLKGVMAKTSYEAGDAEVKTDEPTEKRKKKKSKKDKVRDCES